MAQSPRKLGRDPLKYLAFLAGAMIAGGAARADAARQADTVAAQSVALTELDVLTATANAYMNLVAAQSLAKVAQANVERLQAFSQAIHVLVANKLRPGVEGEQADAAEALA